MKFRSLTVLALLATPAFAHDGPRVWVADVDGTLVTQSSDDDYDPSVYANARVFQAELSPYFGVRTTQFPGYEVPRDGSGNVPSNATLGFKIAGPLLVADATHSRLITTTARYGIPAPQLSLSLPGVPSSQAAAYTRVTSTGVVAGFDFLTDLSIGEHGHLAYTLLGDGASATAIAPDDAYVLPMVLTSNAMSRSDWFFLVLNKDASTDQLAAANALVQPLVNAKPGDTNFDGHVDFNDLVTLAQHYNQPAGQWWATGDFNFDGAVGFDDLVPLAQNYGKPAAFAADWQAALATVPEPSSLLLSFGAIALLTNRRGRRLCCGAPAPRLQ